MRSYFYLFTIAPLSAAAAEYVASTSGVQYACTQIQESLPSATYMAPTNESTYETLRTVNLSYGGTLGALGNVVSAHNTWLHPACIVTPATTEGLSRVLNILTSSQTQFSIRSGGHSFNTGWSNSRGGVLIDTQLFSDITYRPSEESVVVGVGLRWHQVYEYLEPLNVTVIGGRVPPIGVGGLVMGGGLSYRSNELGLAADNVVNVELVTAAGHVINANSTHNQDLFWALKGGTNNFGVVTYYTLRTYPMGDIWGGTLGYSLDRAAEVLDAIVEYQKAGQLDLNSGICGQFLLTNDTVFVTVFYSKPIANPPAFSAFKDIPTVLNTTSIRSWTSLLEEAASTTVTRYHSRTTTIKLDQQSYQAALNVTAAASGRMVGIQGGTLLAVVQPISRNQVSRGRKNGGNALGLTELDQMWLGITMCWELASDDETIYAISHDVLQQVESGTKARQTYLPYQFLNDAAFDQDPLRNYGASNLHQLRKVAAKYDPTSVFQNLVVGGFKLYA